LPRSIQTWQEHTNCIYQTIFSPRSAELFASCSGDQTVKIWDVRQPHSVNTFRAHNNEVLALDWNKYYPDQIVTGSADSLIKVWDLRMTQAPIDELVGHQYAVRRIKCSPHNGNIIGSTSYDMTMRVWDISQHQTIFLNEEHTEFVLGLDFSLFNPNLIATCGWDELVCLFRI
jgi:peroxin-7